MFGYILPHTCSLRVCENELYKATYCGLCKDLKKRFCNFSRLYLTYDMVFFAVFCISYFEEDISFEKRFCGIHPFKKRFCLKSSLSLKIAADISVILFYFKLKDNILDCKNIKKFLNYIIVLLFKSASLSFFCFS